MRTKCLRIVTFFIQKMVLFLWHRAGDTGVGMLQRWIRDHLICHLSQGISWRSSRSLQSFFIPLDSTYHMIPQWFVQGFVPSSGWWTSLRESLENASVYWTNKWMNELARKGWNDSCTKNGEKGRERPGEIISWRWNNGSEILWCVCYLCPVLGSVTEITTLLVPCSQQEGCV